MQSYHGFSDKVKQYQYIVLYIIALVGISFLRVPDDCIFVIISDYLSFIIPSIRLVSESVENTNSAKIILSIAWMAIVPCSFFAIKSVNSNRLHISEFKTFILDKVGTKNIYLAYVISLTMIAALFVAMVLGNPLGGYSSRRVALTKLVSIHTAFLSLYAIGLTIAASAIFVFVYLILKSVRSKT